MNLAGSDRCRHLGMSPEVFLESFQTQFSHVHRQMFNVNDTARISSHSKCLGSSTELPNELIQRCIGDYWDGLKDNAGERDGYPSSKASLYLTSLCYREIFSQF